MEEKLMTEYVGDEMYKQKYFSAIPAVLGQFMGPVWFFYKKAYLLGFIYIVISYIVAKIAVAMGLTKASFIMFFIYLFSTKQLYTWDVKRKVNKIIAHNRDKSEDELVEIVRKKGGKSIGAAVLYVILLLIYIILTCAAILYTGIQPVAQ